MTVRAPRERCLGVAGDLRASHREAHVGKEAAGSSLPDGARLLVQPDRHSTDRVDAELLGEQRELVRSHVRHCARRPAPGGDGQ